MANDIMGPYEGVLKLGTQIVFKNVAAYTLSYRENFIFHSPDVHVINWIISQNSN